VTESTLRILMLAPTPYFSDRGCHVRIYEEARALIQAGHQVTVVTYHLGRDMPGIPTVRIPPVPWYRKQEAGPSWHKPYLDLILLMTAFRVVRSFKPHCIHAHLHEGVAIGFVLKKLFGIPLLFDYQGSLSDESLQHGFFGANSLLHRLFRAIEQTLNRSADAIVTSSTAAADDLSARWKIPPAKVTPLIDAVDMTTFMPHDREIIRQKLGISSGARLIVYLGVLSRYQGIDMLLEALSDLMKQDPTVHALIMGFPEAHYLQQTKDLKLDDRIIFTGKIAYEDAAKYLSSGDLAVSPKLSATEANGKLFNYMACGLPTVVFDSPINREILGETGWYAAEKSAPSFAATIREAFDSGELLEKSGIASRERARLLHSWECRIETLTGVYRTML